MEVVSIISTKGGVGKTTTAANLGGFVADAGLRVLLLDLDVQPTLSSYYPLRHRAPGGIYELLAFNERRIEQVVSHTSIAGLDLVLSNDDRGELNTLLLHAPDGRLRLRNLLPVLAPFYDLLLIDTQGARSVVLEMAVLASRLALSPVTPEILAVSANARLIQQTLRELFQGHHSIHVLDTDVPAIEAYPRASMQGLPVHRVEYRQPAGRVAPAALETMRQLAAELFPDWQAWFAQVSGRPGANIRNRMPDHGENS